MPGVDLKSSTIIPVRFSEVDMMQIVWHGNYIKYIEEGREAFGKKYGISYMQIKDQGFMAPVVNLNIDFKKPLKYGDNALVETFYQDSEAAKIIYTFKIYRESDHELVATAESVQVFLDHKGELVLTIPEFFKEWKRMHL